MNKFPGKTTRRKFLKAITSSITATTIGITGWSNISGSSKEFRSDLKVFSEGNIGSLRIQLPSALADGEQSLSLGGTLVPYSSNLYSLVNKFNSS